MPATTPIVDVKIISATTLPQTDNELIKAYPTVFDGHIRVMQCEEFHISLATNVKPFVCTRLVRFHLHTVTS